MREEEVADVMAVVQAAAAGRSTIDLTIGPLQTFGQRSPVRFLAVDPWDPVVELYRACWTGVLEREERRPFHPHVTVDIEGGTTQGPDPAVDVLASYRAEVTIDRVTILEHIDIPGERRWETFLSYRFG